MKRSCPSEVYVHSSDSEDESEIVRSQRLLASRRSHTAATRMGISSREYRRMKRWKVPNMFFGILACIHLLEGWVEMTFHGAEWMCGIGMVEAGLVEQCLLAFGYDIEFGPHNDFTSPEGFVCATSQSRRLRPYSSHS